MSKKEIRLRVSGDFHAALEQAAKAREIPITALVTVAVYDYMNKPKPPEPKRFSLEGADMSEWLDDDDEPLNVGS